MSTVYASPGAFGLRIIGEVDFEPSGYGFALSVLWYDELDQRFMYGEDSGCSCPSPFESTESTDLRPVASSADLRSWLVAHAASNGTTVTTTVDIDRMINRAREAGLK